MYVKYSFVSVLFCPSMSPKAYQENTRNDMKGKGCRDSVD